MLDTLLLLSEQGLKNKLKLLVYHANKHELTIQDYYNLKFGTDEYKDINFKINQLVNIKYDQKLSSNHSSLYSIDVPIPTFDSSSDNNRLNELLSNRGIKFI